MAIPITVTLTHYKRIDLLQQTIESFMRTNLYPISEFIIVDDSGDKSYSDKIIELYSNKIRVIVNDENIGQRRSIDRLLQESNNDYIFHLEEDWLFEGTEPQSYIEDSIRILENNKNIHQVHIRHQNDDPHPTIGDDCYIDNIGYKFLDNNFRGVWNGFSFNPGLRRKSDLHRMFPNGLIEFKDEMAAAIHVRKFNYCAVRLTRTVCRHIGYEHGTQTGGRGF
jgi:hypothetical protein